MMRILTVFIFFTLLSGVSLYAQEDKWIQVIVYKNRKEFKDFAVINLMNHKKGVKKDTFQYIRAFQNDELLITSDAFENTYSIVYPEDFYNEKIEIFINEKIIPLEEIVLTDAKLFHGKFTDYTPKTYTPAERRLATATKYLYKDGVITLDPVINAISGRTKKLKKRLKAEGKNLNVEFLDDNYKDFILKDLKVPKEEYLLFCYFITDSNKDIKEMPEEKVKPILRQGYLAFLQTLTKD